MNWLLRIRLSSRTINSLYKTQSAPSPSVQPLARSLFKPQLQFLVLTYPRRIITGQIRQSPIDKLRQETLIKRPEIIHLQLRNSARMLKFVMKVNNDKLKVIVASRHHLINKTESFLSILSQCFKAAKIAQMKNFTPLKRNSKGTKMSIHRENKLLRRAKRYWTRSSKQMKCQDNRSWSKTVSSIFCTSSKHFSLSISINQWLQPKIRSKRRDCYRQHKVWSTVKGWPLTKISLSQTARKSSSTLNSIHWQWLNPSCTRKPIKTWIQRKMKWHRCHVVWICVIPSAT